MSRILAYLGLVIIAILGVTIDLFTTKVGLLKGLVELNPLGNMPLIYYPWMIGAATLIFWYGNFLMSTQVEPFKTKFKMVWLYSCLFVCFLPYLASVWNVIQISQV